MATAAVAVPSHAPQQQQQRRRATSTCPQTVPVHYPLTGFVRIEDGSSGSGIGKRPAPGLVGAASSKKALSSKSAAATHTKGCSRWLYGVLLPGKLQLYARRTDYKRKTAPSDEILMQVHATSANESVFGFDHECVYIRCRDTGHVVTVRIHQKKEIVRWVTALYYQSFSSDGKSPLAASAAANDKHDSERPPEPGSSLSTADAVANTVTTKRKSVSFQDVPDVLVLPRDSVDPAELFYSVREYEQFQQTRASGSAAEDDGDDDDDDGDGAKKMKKKKNLSRLMKSIYAKTAAKLRVSHKRSSMEQLR